MSDPGNDFITRDDVVVIAGPTACGKTQTAVALAKAMNAEVVSADSAQIYKRLDIGSAKPTAEEMRGVPHHLIDLLEPDAPYSAALFAGHAISAIKEAAARGRRAVICGGTGLYLRAAMYALDFGGAPPMDARRAEWARLSCEDLYAELRRMSPEDAERLNPNDRKRIVRALETAPSRVAPPAFRTQQKRFPSRLYCLYYPRETLYARIDARVDDMLARGLVEETRALLSEGAVTRGSQAMGHIGYRQIAAYLSGETTLGEAVCDIKRATRRFAKRQLTWFRHEPGAVWLDMSARTPEEAAEIILADEARPRGNI